MQGVISVKGYAYIREAQSENREKRSATEHIVKASEPGVRRGKNAFQANHRVYMRSWKKKEIRMRTFKDNNYSNIKL